MTALFELAAEYRALADKLSESDLDETTIADTLDGASGDLEDKIINTAKYARNEEAEADAIESAIKDMQARLKSKRTHVANIKKYIADNMERAGKAKVPSPWFVVSMCNNPESVEIMDESLIPRDYFREIPASLLPDKSLIKVAIKEGYEVPGCAIKRTQRLQIK